MELKKKVVSGFVWTASEKFGSMLLQLVVSFILARLLEPSDFGLVGMLTVFSVVGTTIVDSGFSQALIQRHNPSQKDYSSVFYLNIIIALALFSLLWGLSVPIARFYGEPALVRLAPWIFAIIPLNALGIIQTTSMSAGMRFGRLSGMNFTAAMAAGTIGIVMALTGWGVWALVFQLFSLNLVRSLLLWGFGRWRPTTGFSLRSVRGLFGYGSRLFATGLISQVFNNLSQLIIGKAYSPAQLGFYYKSLQFKDMTANTVSHSIVSVTFPAFSRLQNDRVKLLDSARKVVAVLSFFLFPLMAGLIAITDQAFPLLLTGKWDPAIPYFKIFCLSGFTLPTAVIGLNILKAVGDSRSVLRLEVVKKLFAISVVVYAATISVLAMVWAYLIWMSFEMILNGIFAGRAIGYRAGQQLSDTLPYLVMSAVMYLVVSAVGGLASPLGMTAVILIKIVTGIAVYAGLCLTVRPAAFAEAASIMRGMMPGSRQS